MKYIESLREGEKVNEVYLNDSVKDSILEQMTKIKLF